MDCGSWAILDLVSVRCEYTHCEYCASQNDTGPIRKKKINLAVVSLVGFGRNK